MLKKLSGKAILKEITTHTNLLQQFKQVITNLFSYNLAFFLVIQDIINILFNRNYIPITMRNLKALFKETLAESNVLVAIVTVVVATILIDFY